MYYKALCYCLGMNDDTRRNVDSIYNFKTSCVKSECLHEGWQTSGSAKVVRMAFNLYCNGAPSVNDEQDAEEQMDECRRYSVEDLFCCCYAPYFWQAIQSRYPEYATYNKNLYVMYGDNAYPDNCDDFIEIMDILYPFIDADAIQSVCIGFYMTNSKYREQIDINRKDGVVMYETIFDNGSRMFSMYADKTGVREFLDELTYSELPIVNTNGDGLIGENTKVGKYKCRIICHNQEEITFEGVYDRDGVLEKWADFINAIKDFLKGYERREMFNPEHF